MTRLRSATNHELKRLAELADAGLNKFAAARALGRDRGFVDRWAKRLELTFVVAKGGPGPRAAGRASVMSPMPLWRRYHAIGLAADRVRLTMRQLQGRTFQP